MGQSQSKGIVYQCIQFIKEYKVKQVEQPVIGSFAQLLKLCDMQKINEKQIKLTKTSTQSFVLKSQSAIEDIQTFVGCVQIYNQKEGLVFQGVVYEGKKKQFGKDYNSKGEIVYQGQFNNDMYQGWGKTKHYTGQFYQGKMHGWGIYIDQQKDVRYQGLFQAGLFNGIGFVNLQEKQVRNFMENETFLSQSDPTFKYAGQWKEGVISGSGKIATKQQIYSGQFTRGIFNGQGKLIDKGGKKIEGKFYFGMTM